MLFETPKYCALTVLSSLSSLFPPISILSPSPPLLSLLRSKLKKDFLNVVIVGLGHKHMPVHFPKTLVKNVFLLNL